MLQFASAVTDVTNYIVSNSHKVKRDKKERGNKEGIVSYTWNIVKKENYAMRSAQILVPPDIHAATAASQQTWITQGSAVLDCHMPVVNTLAFLHGSLFLVRNCQIL